MMKRRKKNRAQDHGATPTHPFSRPGFRFALGMVALVFFTAIYGLVNIRNQENSARPQPEGSFTAAPSVPQTERPVAKDTEDECPANSSPAPDADASDAPPADTTWNLYRGVAMPYSAGAGPTVIEEGEVARCFSGSKQGAVLAAIHISARSLFSPLWRDVIAKQVVPGEGRDAFMRLKQRSQGSDIDKRPPSDSKPQIAGYRFVMYSQETAVLQIVTRQPANASLQSSVVTVVRDRNDWKLQLLPDGSASPRPQQLPTLVGFREWSGF